MAPRVSTRARGYPRAMRPYRAFALLGLGCAVACAETSGTNNYAGAVALAGMAAGAAVVHRAATKGCYAYICAYGTECDHDTGLCVPIQERADAAAPAQDDTEPEMCPVPDASLLVRAPCDAGRDAR